MTDQDSTQQPPADADEYAAGQRSITRRIGTTRFEMVKAKQRRSLKGRPYIIGAIVVVVLLLIVPAVAFVNTFVVPPRQVAIQVGDAIYTRGDVVDLIRFNQRVSEDTGIPFQLGSSVFEILQTMQDAELSYQVAPAYGISVEPEEVERQVEFILGFIALNAGEQESGEYQLSVAETKRQFLNKVGLPEEVWTDFIKKIMFQERIRNLVSESVERIQPQVHMYEILLDRNDPQLNSTIDRELIAGTPVEDVVLAFSVDPNVLRTNGDRGWFPDGISPRLDRLLFGLDEDGNRLLPFRRASQPQFDGDSQTWSIVVVDEYQEARELSDGTFELATDRALAIFLNEERKKFQQDGKLYIDLNSTIVAWVNRQVKFSSLAPTPDPSAALGSSISTQLEAFGLGAARATPVPTPRGIPGISAPIN